MFKFTFGLPSNDGDDSTAQEISPFSQETTWKKKSKRKQTQRVALTVHLV